LIEKHYLPNVMSLGIKDFGAGLSQTNDYLRNSNMTSKTVLSNIKNCRDFDNEGNIEEDFCNLIASSTFLEVDDDAGKKVKIGFVGFVNPNVEKLGSPGALEFSEIVLGLEKSIDDLKKSGIQFIIALGDGSLETARSIIDAYAEVKVVIYGRGFGSSKIMQDYPEGHKNSYIGTAGQYGSSVGQMVIRFDSTTGSIKSKEGSKLVSIDEKIPPLVNDGAVNTMAKLEGMVRVEANKTLGRTHVTIHGGDVCWTDECNLGNIMADAAVHCAYKWDTIKFDIPEGPLLGIWHGGALFYDKVQQKDTINRLDVHKWLPYHNNVHIVAITGASLKKLFEASATALDIKNPRNPKWGQFLQVSNGMEVTYSTSGGHGSVEKIRVIKDHDTVPKMKEVEDTDRFLLAMPSFLREGRSVFDFVKNENFFLNIPTQPNNFYFVGFDDDCLGNYTQSMGGLMTGFEERIFIDVDDSSAPGSPKCKNNNNKAKHVLLTLFITLLILGGIFLGWKWLWPKFNSGHHPSIFQNQS